MSDEVERLTKINEELVRAHNSYVIDNARKADEIARQATTIATLRKALEAVCEEYDNCWHDEDGFGKLERTVREARAALGNSTEKEKP